MTKRKHNYIYTKDGYSYKYIGLRCINKKGQITVNRRKYIVYCISWSNPANIAGEKLVGWTQRDNLLCTSPIGLEGYDDYVNVWEEIFDENDIQEENDEG